MVALLVSPQMLVVEHVQLVQRVDQFFHHLVYLHLYHVQLVRGHHKAQRLVHFVLQAHIHLQELLLVYFALKAPMEAQLA